MLKEGQQTRQRGSTVRVVCPSSSPVSVRDPTILIRKRLESVVIIVQSQADLFQIITALHSTSGFARGLHGGKQEGDQNTNDSNHHQ